MKSIKVSFFSQYTPNATKMEHLTLYKQTRGQKANNFDMYQTMQEKNTSSIEYLIIMHSQISINQTQYMYKTT